MGRRRTGIGFLGFTNQTRNKMMKATLNLEFMAGTGIDEAISEAKRIAIQLKVNIRFNFNGIPLIVRGSSEIQEKIEEYHKSISTKFE